jgi:hypothetical protein
MARYLREQCFQDFNSLIAPADLDVHSREVQVGLVKPGRFLNTQGKHLSRAIKLPSQGIYNAEIIKGLRIVGLQMDCPFKVRLRLAVAPLARVRHSYFVIQLGIIRAAFQSFLEQLLRVLESLLAPVKICKIADGQIVGRV